MWTRRLTRLLGRAGNGTAAGKAEAPSEKPGATVSGEAPAEAQPAEPKEGLVEDGEGSDDADEEEQDGEEEEEEEEEEATMDAEAGPSAAQGTRLVGSLF